MDTTFLKYHKVRSSSYGDVSLLIPQNNNALLDLKKLSQERLRTKKSATVLDKNSQLTTLIKVSSLEKDLDHYKSPGKLRSEENQLIFSKNACPKSSFKGDNTQKLIKKASSAADLFSKQTKLPNFLFSRANAHKDGHAKNPFKLAKDCKDSFKKTTITHSKPPKW